MLKFRIKVLGKSIQIDFPSNTNADITLARIKEELNATSQIVQLISG